MLFHHAKNLKSKMLIQGHIIRIMGFQRYHELVLVSITDDLSQQQGRQAVVLHLRPDGQVDNVYPFCLEAGPSIWS